MQTLRKGDISPLIYLKLRTIKRKFKNLSSFFATKKRLPRKVNALKFAYYDFVL